MTTLTILKQEIARLKNETKILHDVKGKLLAEGKDVIGIENATIQNIEEIVKKEKEIQMLQKNQKDEAKKEKETKREEFLWIEFKKAHAIWSETKMCFYKNNQPKFFYKNVYQDFDAKTHLPLPPKTELLFFPPATLSQNWPELNSKESIQFLTQMIHGWDITIKDPKETHAQVHSFDKRVYTKLGNTRQIPDSETYNMIDLVHIMSPNGEQDECPPLIYQLLLALSGNVVKEDGTLSKPENLEWLEKWIYGVLVADIGNNQMSFPVFFGPGKVGKNAMFDKVFKQVLGSEQVFTGLWEHMDGNFTGFKLGKVFIFIDEIKSKDDWNKLKNLTGSPEQLIKQKYGPEFVVENTTAMAIGANDSTYPLPLEDGRQMSRVSPIATDANSTFAGNVVKYFENEQPGLLAEMLKNQKVDVDSFNGDTYELGDKFLRLYEDMWCGKEVVQEFLNYLHKKYKDEKFTLASLRGQDWENILKSKPNPLHEVVKFVLLHNPDIITKGELYEIYKVIIGDKKEFVKGANNFCTQITPLLQKEGYTRKDQCRVVVQATDNTKTQTVVFHKQNLNAENHIQSIDDYICEEKLGVFATRVLKYPEDNTDQQHKSSATQHRLHKVK